MFEGGRLEGQPLSDGFVAGLAARHDAAATALRHAFSERPRGFAPADLIARIQAARPDDAGPKHFSPADRASNPTEGWDPLKAAVQTPQLDPVELARAEGYAEGLAAARAAVDEAAERDKALLGELLDQLQAGDRIDREAVTARLRQTVLLLVGKLVGEIGVSADLLAGRIETAAISDAFAPWEAPISTIERVPAPRTATVTRISSATGSTPAMSHSATR